MIDSSHFFCYLAYPMGRLAFCFFLLFSSFLIAEETITVHLSTKENPSSLYLHLFHDNHSGFEAAYLVQLEEILAFDLNHNGKTQTVSAEPADYVVKAKIFDRQLSITTSSAETGAVKGIENISLSGQLVKDRKVMHRLADAICEAFFDLRGIADTKILYTLRNRKSENASEWVTEVWESDYDGANARQITHDNYLCVNPCYIPTKEGGRPNQFLYVGYQVGQPKIYAASTEKGVGKRLTYLKGNQLMPVISPQKDLIAFISDISGNPDLFIQNFSLDSGLEGKPRQIFSAPQATQGTPTFSPNGKKLAFVSNKDGTPRIYIIDISSTSKRSKPTLISKQNRNNTCPAWSPDGTKIAYSASTNGIRQIWFYDITLNKERQLTDGPDHKENPVWAPNSLHLMFNSSTPIASELYLINLNQKKGVQITSGPGEKRFPAWEYIDSKQERRT